ncbi:transposase [Aureibacillus halotolerans]|uniref:transposase n=1 Tax=Aureibacillus halotolerans TaxID=1508390 RepID=UPI00105D7EF2
MDDFAFRKGHDYGTLLCDLTTHAPIDVLPDRNEETVKEWFQKRPFIQLVTRDWSQSFQKEIKRALPYTQHISDRFHLVHNLGSLLKRILQKSLPNRIPKEPTVQPVSSEPTDPVKQVRDPENGQKARKRSGRSHSGSKN